MAHPQSVAPDLVSGDHSRPPSLDATTPREAVLTTGALAVARPQMAHFLILNAYNSRGSLSGTVPSESNPSRNPYTARFPGDHQTTWQPKKTPGRSTKSVSKGPTW